MLAYLQECDRVQIEASVLKVKITELENGAVDKKVERELQAKVNDLEMQIGDKNKVSYLDHCYPFLYYLSQPIFNKCNNNDFCNWII